MPDVLLIQLLPINTPQRPRSRVVPIRDLEPLPVDQLTIVLARRNRLVYPAAGLRLVQSALAARHVFLPQPVNATALTGAEEQVPKVLLLLTPSISQHAAQPGFFFIIERVVPADAVHRIGHRLLNLRVREQPQSAVLDDELLNLKLEAAKA